MIRGGRIIRVLGFGALVLLLATGLPGARADTIQFDLSVPNVGLSGEVGPYAHVVIDVTGGVADVTATALGVYKFGGNDAFGLNVDSANFSISNLDWTGGTLLLGPPCAAGPSNRTCLVQTGAGNEDGFGSFNLRLANNDGQTAAVNVITFTLTNINGGFANASSVLTENNNGYLAAAHIFPPAGTLTGFAANGDTSISEIPEPGTGLLFLGTGFLLLLGGAVRRPLLRKF